MKKILFLLLLSSSAIFAQVSTGSETPFDTGIKNNSSQQVLVPDTLVTRGADGTYGHTSSSLLPVSTATQIAIDAKVGDFINDGATTIAPSMNAVYDALAIKKDNTSTALKSGLAIVNNGTTFNINSGVYEIVDNSTTPATRATITFAGASNITPLYPRTIVYLDNAGAVQQLNGASGDLTPLQRRDNLFIGILSVFSGTIVAPQFTPSISYDDSGRIVDLSESIGVINRDGNLIGANGANLQFNKGAGHTFRVGGNYATDKKVPDVTTDAALVPVPAGINLVAYRNGSGGWTYEPFSGSITPNFWDNGTGTKATVDNNKFTTQRIYFFNGTDTFVIYLGQNQYASIDEAIAAVNNASRVIDPATSLASLRSSLIVKKNTTALNVATDAQFLEGPKINGGATGSAVASQNLQGTYNSSVTPHITTSTTGGALAIKRGSASDTDNVLVVQNGSGSDTFYVAGNGDTGIAGNIAGFTGTFSSSMQAASFNLPGGTSSQFLKANGSVDSNVYATNSSVVHLSGSETISGNKTFTGENTFTSAASSTAITVTASTSGNGITVNNNSNGKGFTVNNNSTGVGEIINSAAASTSDLTRWQKDGTTTSKVDHNGNITAPSFIKSGGTSSQFLKADGSVDSTVYAPSTGGTGYIQNTNTSAQSANMWISGKGIFESGLSVGTSSTLFKTMIKADTNVISLGLVQDNDASYGYGFKINSSTGDFNLNRINAGLDIGNLFSLTPVGAATFASTVTAPIFIGNLTGSATQWAGVPYGGGTGSSSGIDFMYGYNSTTNTAYNLNITAAKSFLGISSAITGTLTSGYIPKATGANSLGNSIVQDNGSDLGIGVTPTAGGATQNFEMLNGSTFASRISVPQLYISSNAVGQAFSPTRKVDGYATQIVQQGFDGGMAFNNAISSTAGSAISWNTAMYISASSNVGIGTTSPVKRLHVKGGNDNVLYLDNAGEQYTSQYFANNGTTKSFLVWDNTSSVFDFGTAISADLRLLTNNTERMRITFGGNVLINTTTDDGVNKLQVEGSAKVSSLAGTGTRMVTADSSGNLGNASGATIDSPALTGTPTAPTATAGTNTTQIATTAFVQTATRPYKSYTALLTQSGTSAPTATVLENTLGTVTFGYTSTGSFTATSSGLFTSNKTAVFTQELFGLDSKAFEQITSSSNINLYTSSGGAYINGLYSSTLIEIRVYN